MQFMFHVVGIQSQTFAEGEGPRREDFIAWHEAATAAGVLVSGGFYDDWRQARSVQVGADGGVTVIEGAPPGSTEYLGGYDVVEVGAVDEALEWAGRHPGARWGRIEVRPLLG